MLNGDDANASELTFSAHTGTHVDAPRHFVPWKNQHGMETVDIGAMNGPALLIEAYDVPVLNREALEALDIPHAGVSRLIIRTDNTRRKLMHTTAFTPDYVAFDTEGAKWLVEHRPDIRAIGLTTCPSLHWTTSRRRTLLCWTMASCRSRVWSWTRIISTWVGGGCTAPH